MGNRPTKIVQRVPEVNHLARLTDDQLLFHIEQQLDDSSSRLSQHFQTELVDWICFSSDHIREYIQRNTHHGYVSTTQIHKVMKKYNRSYFITMHNPNTIRVQFVVVPPEAERKTGPASDIKIRVYKPRQKKPA